MATWMHHDPLKGPRHPCRTLLDSQGLPVARTDDIIEIKSPIALPAMAKIRVVSVSTARGKKENIPSWIASYMYDNRYRARIEEYCSGLVTFPRGSWALGILKSI